MEIIRIVEASKLHVRRTLEELDVSRSTFYDWYRRYHAEGQALYLLLGRCRIDLLIHPGRVSIKATRLNQRV